jgi:hypothetical protein
MDVVSELNNEVEAIDVTAELTEITSQEPQNKSENDKIDSVAQEDNLKRVNGEISLEDESQKLSLHSIQENVGGVPAEQALDMDMDPIFFREVQEEATVDEMKIQTMYKMVEDVSVRVQGKEVVKKVLYLTNKQSNLFDEQAMVRCIQALDIGDPKFVIKLVPSLGVESQVRIAHTELSNGPHFQFESTGYSSSELDKGDDAIIETQILLLMRTCILPIAKQTRAVILVGGANDCYLSAALSNVVLAEQARLGKDCPFTVIATAHAYEVHAQAASIKNRASLSAQLARGCKAWAKRMPEVQKYLTSKSSTRMQRCDLTPAASRYIIFESFDESMSGAEKVTNNGARQSFEATLLQCLTRKLPSIAIQSHLADSGIGYLTELAARNIPVLLLDSTERPITIQKLLPASGLVTRLANESNALPTVSKQRLDRIQVYSDSLTMDGRQELLDIAFEMAERKWHSLTQHGVYDALNTSMIAFLHSALRLGVRTGESSAAGANVPLHARIRELERLQRSNKDSTKAQVPPELAARTISFLLTRSGALATQAKLARVEKWLESHEPSADHLVPLAISRRDQLRTECAAIEAAGGILKASPAPQRWIELYDILTSANTYSGSIHDLDGLKRILGSVAKIDRLPAANSLEALRTLQEAWSCAEAYHHVAGHYKRVSKATYILLLLIGIAITALSLAQYQLAGFSSRSGVIAASFAGTAVAAYVSYTNPGQKWQHLRVAASAIESNIWMFRTRAGPYRTAGEGQDSNADSLLADTVREIKAGVLEGADLKATSFFSSTRLRNGHGQSPSSPASGWDTEKGNLPGKATDGDQAVSAQWNAAGGGIGSWGGGNINRIHAGMGSDEQDSRGGRAAAASKDKRDSVPSGFFAHGRRGRAPVAGGDGGSGPGAEVRLDEVVAWLCHHDLEPERITRDSHYTPVQPDAYIQFRVARALVFYQQRIPRCSRARSLSQTLLLLGSIASGVLAFADFAVWAAAVSIVASAITAYLEYQGTAGKIDRYSVTVHALQELVFWWQTLPQIDRSVVANIDRLVLSCEDILQREQQAWRSTSQAMRLLRERTKAAAQG